MFIGTRDSRGRTTVVANRTASREIATLTKGRRIGKRRRIGRLGGRPRNALRAEPSGWPRRPNITIRVGNPLQTGKIKTVARYACIVATRHAHSAGTRRSLWRHVQSPVSSWPPRKPPSLPASDTAAARRAEASRRSAADCRRWTGRAGRTHAPSPIMLRVLPAGRTCRLYHRVGPTGAPLRGTVSRAGRAAVTGRGDPDRTRPQARLKQLDVSLAEWRRVALAELQPARG